MAVKIQNAYITRMLCSGDCADQQVTRLIATTLEISGSVGSTSCSPPSPPPSSPPPSWSPSSLGATANTFTYDDFIDVGINVSYVVYFNNKLQAFSNGGNNYLYESTDGGDTWSYNSTAGTGLSCWYATPPLVESNRILWSNGAGNGSKLYQWTGTGTASEVSLLNITISASGILRVVRKIGSYYYLSITDNSYDKVYRSTSLTGMWTEVYSVSSSFSGVTDVVEYNGVIMIIHSNGSGIRTTNDFVTQTTMSGDAGMSIVGDGDGNWLLAGSGTATDNKGRYSEDNGATWTETTGTLRPPSETTGNINVREGSLIKVYNKWLWLSSNYNSGYNSLISTTDPFVASPTTVLEKNFVGGSPKSDYDVNSISLIGNRCFVGGREGNNYGVHIFDIT